MSITRKLEIAKKIPFALLIYTLIPRFLGVELPISDSFHVGEYFAAATTLWNEPASSPLTIHGGWDFIPAIAARWLAGGENYFYPTIYLTESVAPALAAGILLLLLTRILRGKVNWPTIIFLSTAAIAAPYLVGIRDLFLVTNCWILYEYMTPKLSIRRKRMAVFLVIISSLGVMWSFERGIAGVVTVLTTLLSAAYFEKKAIYLKTSSLVVIGASLIIAIAQLSGTMEYFYNLSFLAQISSQWRYVFGQIVIRDSLLAIVFVASTIAATISANKSENRGYLSAYWLGIGACALMMLRIGTNRADMGHVVMAMWAPLILTAYSYSTRKESSDKPSIAVTLPIFSMVAYFSWYYAYKWGVMPLPILAISFSSSFMWLQQLGRTYRIRVFLTSISLWIILLSLAESTWTHALAAKGVLKGRIVTPLEYLYKGVAYSRVADPGNAWAAKSIRDSQSKCLLDMTNSGIINAGADLPTCIQVSYPVYATKLFEEKILREIADMKANAIVYSTENWQYFVHGKDMKVRFPRVDELLISNYPEIECREKYCIRRKKTMD